MSTLESLEKTPQSLSQLKAELNEHPSLKNVAEGTRVMAEIFYQEITDGKLDPRVEFLARNPKVYLESIAISDYESLPDISRAQIERASQQMLVFMGEEVQTNKEGYELKEQTEKGIELIGKVLAPTSEAESDRLKRLTEDPKERARFALIVHEASQAFADGFESVPPRHHDIKYFAGNLVGSIGNRL